MLCPKCGSEVGEFSELCAACRDSEDSAPLARIKVKQIRKEVTPEEREAYERQKAAYHEGHEERVTFTSGSHQSPPRARRSNKLSNFTFVIILLALALVGLALWQLAPSWQEQGMNYDQFAHIPVKTDPIVIRSQEVPDKGGVLFLNESRETLVQSELAYDPERDLLYVRFSHAALRSPRLYLEYRFISDSHLCDLANVTAIRAELITEGGVKHFEIPVEAIGGRHLLSGKLAKGGDISGEMTHKDVVYDANSNEVSVMWKTRFQGIVGEPA